MNHSLNVRIRPPHLTFVFNKAVSAILRLPIKHQPTEFVTLTNNSFAGPPNPQIDAAWHGLLEHINIRVSKAELDQSQRTSVELPDGGGYLSWLAVYHELHCLVNMREEYLDCASLR